MAPKRPGKSRRRPAKQQRGRKTTPAALFFFAGVAVAAVILFFGYAFYYLPGHQAPKPTVQTSAGKAPVQAPAAQEQAPAPEPTQGAGKPPTPDTAAQAPEAPQAPAQPVEGKPAGPPRLAIVIDDLGNSLDQARELLDLGLPLTFSILPGLPHTTEVDAMAAKAHREVILHQPMEAHGVSADPGFLRPGMAAHEVAQILAANLAQLPHAGGVSNHMGSKATEDPALMDDVMTELKHRNVFFLDSLTSAKSVAGREAARAGVATLSRTVFLDSERGQQATLLMLAQAEKDARAKGHAVAIGHPYPETIGALAVWSLRRDKGIQLVSLARLLKND